MIRFLAQLAAAVVITIATLWMLSYTKAADDIFYFSDIKKLEIRCCTEPVRKIDGRLARDRNVVEKFRKIHPCPTGAKLDEPCEGWAVDHVIPLACGGRDIVSNLQWLPDAIKSTDDPNAKDRWERKVYCR